MRPRTRLVTGLWAVLSALSIAPLAAEEFVIVGPRAMGMGGAGVAVTRGSLSNYWNPAGLSPPRAPADDSFFDMAIPVGISGFASESVLRGLSDIVDIVEGTDFNQIENQLENGLPLNDLQVQRILQLADLIPELEGTGQGLVSSAHLGLQLRFGRFGFGGLGLFHGGARTIIDRSFLALGNSGLGAAIPVVGNNPATAAGQALADQLVDAGLVNAAQAAEIAFQAEQAGIDIADPAFQSIVNDVLEATNSNAGGDLQSLVTNNQSGVSLRGILLAEVGAGYAQPLGEIFESFPFNALSVGVHVKAMHGTTYDRPFNIRQLEGFDDIFDELTSNSNREESVRVGVDVGILFQPVEFLSIGVVGRNLNSPEFSLGTGGDYRVDPQARAGIGLIDILPGLTLAADLDLTKNDSPALRGFESQNLAFGIEYDIADWDFLALRFGLSQNLAQSDAGLVLHGGIGLNFWGVSIEGAVQAATDRTDVGDLIDSDYDEIPETFGASLMIGINVPLD